MNGMQEIVLKNIDAVIFDMDGVITETATIHAASWKELFDGYLQEKANRTGKHYRPFSLDPDYYEYIDGKPRYDGVKSFLDSRELKPGETIEFEMQTPQRTPAANGSRGRADDQAIGRQAVGPSRGNSP